MRSFTLKITEAELATIAQGLAAMPYGRVQSLMASLDKQISTQMAPQGKPDEPKRTSSNGHTKEPRAVQ